MLLVMMNTAYYSVINPKIMKENDTFSAELNFA